MMCNSNLKIAADWESSSCVPYSIIRLFDHSIISRNGFTLIEMLVVVGIIAILISASLAGFNGMVNRAQSTKAEELVHEVKVAMVQVMQKEGAWPRPLIAEGSSGRGEVTPEVGAALAKRGALSLSYRTNDDGTAVLSGPDKCGVVDPWAAAVVKRHAKDGANAQLELKVPSGGTVRDHRLRFAIDDDLDGRVTVSGDGVSATIRDSVAVWGAGRDGKFGTRDDIRSWSRGQEE